MRLTCYPPCRRIDQARNEFDRLLHSLPGTGAAPPGSRWTPAFDVLESEKHYMIRADVPGVAREDIAVSLENSVLTIRGERKALHTDHPQGYRRRERRLGRFERRFTLPDSVDSAAISARVSDGVLEISIPKQAAAAPRKIALN
jgi:HSP20 family protein